MSHPRIAAMKRLELAEMSLQPTVLANPGSRSYSQVSERCLPGFQDQNTLPMSQAPQALVRGRSMQWAILRPCPLTEYSACFHNSKQRGTDLPVYIEQAIRREERCPNTSRTYLKDQCDRAFASGEQERVDRTARS